MQIDGKDFLRELGVNDQFYLGNVLSCSEYVTAQCYRKTSDKSSKYIGKIICLNHPAEDGINPHWKIRLNIASDENEDFLSEDFLTQLVDLLESNKFVTRPISIEGGKFESKNYCVVGDLYNDD